MRTIQITMRDLFTSEIVTREIDFSLFSVNNCPSNPETQRELVLNWIADRAEPQHETSFDLVCWAINS